MERHLWKGPASTRGHQSHAGDVAEAERAAAACDKKTSSILAHAQSACLLVLNWRLAPVQIVKEAETEFRFGDAPYLGFERLTMCPLQRKMLALEVTCRKAPFAC